MNAYDVPLEIFADTRSGERNVRVLHELFLASGSRFDVEHFTRVLGTALRSSPDPDLSLSNLLRFTEVTVSPVSLLNDLLEHPVLLDILMRILGNSRFFADILVRDPSLFRWLTASAVLNVPLTPEELNNDVEHILSVFGGVERRLDAVRRMFRRQLLRIGTRDLLGIADLLQVTGELSLLADCAIDATLRCTVDQMQEKQENITAAPFAVIGLGKLGGAELNYSSDIDLLFVYGGESGDGDLQGFFHLLGEKLVQHLSRVTGEGHLFRVDMRLRPESGAGPLARSVHSYLLYYESRGELWERQMLIKARPVAGDRRLGEVFVEALQPFVYPRAFLEHPAESIRRMKARIESSLGEAANVKLMPGGIRDVEFIVQALQLVHGGKRPGLRTGNTLKAIHALSSEGVLPAEEARALGAAYTFYRTLEHRLQTMQNTQTHTIPGDEREKGLLARRMGIASTMIFQQTLRDHLSTVRRIFSRVLTPDTTAYDAGWEAAIDGALTEEGTTRLLTDFGFRDMRQTLRHMRSLAFGSTLTGVRETDTRSRTAFRSIADTLFGDISATPDPDLTLYSFSILAGAQKFPGAFYGQLADPRFRRFIVDTAAVGPRFARILAARPALLESLTSDPDALGRPSGSGIPPAGELHEFKIQQEVRAGVRHLLGFSRFEEMTAELSAVAEFVVRELFFASLPPQVTRPRLALFALGKLGTRELTFDSDLDLLFVADTESAEERSVLEDVAAACVRSLSTVTEHGRLYDVDVRLRPEGRNAPLVVDRGAYRNYLAQRASLWERQSLTRLRFLCGDAQVGKGVMEDVLSFVYAAPLPSRWTVETVAMRRRMESRSRTRGDEIIDLKVGPGGMVDVEFITQMLLLRQGAASAGEGGGAGTVFGILAQADPHVLEPAASEELAEAYRLYRRLELMMRVALEERGSVLPTGERFETLSRCALRAHARETLQRITSTQKQVRSVFLATAERMVTGGERVP